MMQDYKTIYFDALKELESGNYKSPLFPVFIVKSGWVITYHFLSLKGETASLQRIKIKSQNHYLSFERDSVVRRLRKGKLDLSLLQEIPGDWLKEKLSPAQLVKLYKSLANNELLTPQAESICKHLEINERYLTTIKTYLLTGQWCLMTGVIVEIDERGDLAIKIDENISLAELKEHWKIINKMRKLLIPQCEGRKTYDFLERDSEIYKLAKEFIPPKEIAELKKLPEDQIRKIIHHRKKQTRDL